MTEPATTPTPAPEPTAPSAASPAPAAPSTHVSPAPEAVAPSGQPPAADPSGSAPVAAPSVSHPIDGAKPEKRGVIGWLNYYAEDLLAPISKPGRTCERCKRRMWRGYLLSAPGKVKGVADMQIVCWRCKLAAAQQEMARLRTAGRR